MLKREKKEKDITLKQAAGNNLFAVKLLWSVSKSRVIHMVFTSLCGYMGWMFFAVFFMRYISNAIQSETPFSTILAFIITVCAVMLFVTVYSSYTRNVVYPLNDVKVHTRLYDELYRKAENVELSCYEDSSFYDKYTMAVDGAAEKVTESVRLMCEIFAALCAGMVTYIAMFQIDKMLILFVLAPLVGNFVFGMALNKLNLRMYKEQTPFTRRTEYVNRVMYLSDYAKEMRLSKIYNVLENTYNEATVNTINVTKKYIARNIILSFWQGYLSYAIIFEGIMLYGAYCVLIRGSLTLSEFVVLTSMMGLASWALINTSRNLMECNRNGVFLHNLRSFMQHSEKIPENQDGVMPDSIVASVEFKNVSFGYKPGTPVINNISFCITKNSSIALVGHNGAGKSTIIKLLFRLYDPTDGEILVNGTNIKEYNLKAYRSMFAAAFQDYKIFAGTVSENVSMGRESSEQTIINSLERARVLGKINSLQGGINSVLTKEFDEDGQVLSGGEFQKIVVARAFANPAPIKVFDEPSSALDPIAEYELFESILEESRNNLTVFVSHRLSSVKNADEVIMLENGGIIERGTHSDLMQLGGKYADMFMKQAKNYQPDESEVASA